MRKIKEELSGGKKYCDQTEYPINKLLHYDEYLLICISIFNISRLFFKDCYRLYAYICIHKTIINL